MVDSINNIQQYNYITAVPVKSNLQQKRTADLSVNTNPITSLAFEGSKQVINKRTKLSSQDEHKKYTELSKQVDKNTRKQLEILLKSGILLDSNSNDNSTVLDNLYKIATTPRAEGLNPIGIMVDTINTIASPYVITQQFGDIPFQYREKALAANAESKKEGSPDSIDVEHSGTCVASSIEFNLAKKMPAEFARFAEGLSSQSMSVQKNIKFNNLADNALDAIWLLNAFDVPYTARDFHNATLTFKPDKNAIIRAQIQTTNRDALERSPLDVLMQSTFMQIGSQQTYNSLTDRRTGKFNQNDKGLIEFEKTFTESVVEDKSKLSVTYQTLDENARLIGYETDFDTMKRHILTALDMGENVIIGYTMTDRNNVVINGHEITIIGYKKDAQGKLTFICNDTDDNMSQPIMYNEDYLLPKIHHAGLPESVVINDLSFTPNWVEGMKLYKEMKKAG